MPEKSSVESYNRIQTNVDHLIATHGSARAADLIESIALNKNPNIDTIDIQKLIISEVCKVFSINFKLLSTSDADVYKKARKSCFYLLHEYGKLGYGAIKKKFPKFLKTRQRIAASVSEMKSIIDLPGIDKEHYKKHATIEAVVVKFSTKK